MRFPKIKKMLGGVGRAAGAAVQQANPMAFQKMPGMLGGALGKLGNKIPGGALGGAMLGGTPGAALGGMLGGNKGRQAPPGGAMGFFNRNMPQNKNAGLIGFGPPQQAQPVMANAGFNNMNQAFNRLTNQYGSPPTGQAQAPAPAPGQGQMRQSIFNQLQKKQNRGLAPRGMIGMGSKLR